METGTGQNLPQYRIVRFTSIDDLLQEADRLAAAERAGRLQCCGTWTLGQIFGHLATWCSFAFDGSPLKVPFFIRWIMKTQKKRFIRGPMPKGVRIPRVPGGTLGAEEIPLDDGLTQLKQQFQRLASEAPARPHNIFGPLRHDEWIAMNLRHAELHLGYVTEQS